MPPAVDNLKHIIVLMMENRSFDHMLGYLKGQLPDLDGLNGDETNPDTTGHPQCVKPAAEYQGKLTPIPDRSWQGVNVQIFGNAQGIDDGSPKMKGFVKSYFSRREDVDHSRNVMDCFPPHKLPVLATLAQEFAVCDRWFPSLPGPTVPNRLFAHFGTSFGSVTGSMRASDDGQSIQSRLLNAGRSTKIYHYDDQSISASLPFLVQNQRQAMGTYHDFLQDCHAGSLPDYSFVEPNYSNHDTPDGMEIASDQHPDHDVQAGEMLIAEVYNHVRRSPLWKSTLLLIVYSVHGGIFDHVTPPQIQSDGVVDPISGFRFDRLGVRVPAVFVSPWISPKTIIHTQYEHASIPATVASFFIADPARRNLTAREQRAALFTADQNLLTRITPRQDSFYFAVGAAHQETIGMPIHDRGALDIAVPKPSPAAYSPGREMSPLLRDLLQELMSLEQQLPPGQRTNVDVSRLVTEEDANNYAGRVLPLLREAGKSRRKDSRLTGALLIERLKATTAGKADAHSFEQICEDSVKYLFDDDLVEMRRQPRIEDGFQVMDLVARLSPRETHGFWWSLAQDLRCRYIVFEFKNYSNPISQNQVYTTEKYLYPSALRPVAIVIARNGADDGAKRAIQGALRDAGKVLLVFSLDQLIELLRGKDAGHKPSDLMAGHLDRLLTTLAP